MQREKDRRPTAPRQKLPSQSKPPPPPHRIRRDPLQRQVTANHSGAAASALLPARAERDRRGLREKSLGGGVWGWGQQRRRASSAATERPAGRPGRTGPGQAGPGRSWLQCVAPGCLLLPVGSLPPRQRPVLSLLSAGYACVSLCAPVRTTGTALRRGGRQSLHAGKFRSSSLQTLRKNVRSAGGRKRPREPTGS